MNKFLIIVCLFFLSTSFYFSQNKLAVLIANQNYQNISSLKTPYSEIDSLESLFHFFGYKTLVYKDVNLSDFNGIIDSIQKNVEYNGTVYFHYAGHGLQIDNENLIVPASINKDPLDQFELKRKCIRVQDLIDALFNLNKHKNSKSIICLDACRNNPFKEIEHEIKPGLSSINRIPNQSAIVFSCTPGNTSADGNGDFSKFTKSWISRLAECGNDFSRIQKLVEADMYKTYYKDYQMAHFNVSGLNNFHFCENIEKYSSNKNKKEEEEDLFDFYAGVKREIKNSFKKKYYHDVILKSKWIEDYIGNQINENPDNIELQNIIANSYLNLDSIKKAEELYSNLWQKIKSDPNYSELTVDVYFYLARIYSLNKNWVKLKILRRQYISFCQKTGSIFDLTITYDKIAGDFERQGKLDSAIHYYIKSIENSSRIENKTKNEKKLLGGIYNNIANYYLMEKTIDIEKAKFYLSKVIEIYKEINYFEFWAYYDRCRINVDFDEYLNFKEANNLLHELKKNSRVYQYTDIQTYHLKFLEYDILSKQYLLIPALNLLKEIYFDYGIEPKILNSKLKEQSFGEECKTEYWEIEINLPTSARPIIYIDQNQNSKLDTVDIVLKPKLVLSNSVEAVDIGNGLVFYNEFHTFKTDGNCKILKCDFEKYNELVEKKELENSYVDYETNGENTTWKFRLYLSDLNFRNMLPFFIGLKGLRFKNNLIPDNERSIVMFPINEGVDFIIESLRYD